jgi:hypothetical protein
MNNWKSTSFLTLIYATPQNMQGKSIQTCPWMWKALEIHYNSFSFLWKKEPFSPFLFINVIFLQDGVWKVWKFWIYFHPYTWSHNCRISKIKFIPMKKDFLFFSLQFMAFNWVNIQWRSTFVNKYCITKEEEKDARWKGKLNVLEDHNLDGKNVKGIIWKKHSSFTTINLLNIWLRLTFENTHKTRGEEEDKT